MNSKEVLKVGNIIKDSNGEYGIVLEFGIAKFIAYKSGFTPFDCFNNNLIWTKIKNYLAIDHVYELDDYISLSDLNNLDVLDMKDKLTCIWSRE